MTDSQHKPLYNTVLSLLNLQFNLEPPLRDTGIGLVINHELDKGPKPQLMYMTLDIRIYADVTLKDLHELHDALETVIVAEEDRLADQGITIRRRSVENCG